MTPKDKQTLLKLAIKYKHSNVGKEIASLLIAAEKHPDEKKIVGIIKEFNKQIKSRPTDFEFSTKGLSTEQKEDWFFEKLQNKFRDLTMEQAKPLMEKHLKVLYE